MAKARSMEPREFVLSCDKELPADEQTVFLVKPLSALFQAKLDDQTMPVEGASYELEDKDRKVKMPLTVQAQSQREVQKLKECLVGWRNLKTGEGHEVKFESLTPDERINILFLDWRDELCAFLDSMNYMEEAEVKN